MHFARTTGRRNHFTLFLIPDMQVAAILCSNLAFQKGGIHKIFLMGPAATVE